MSATYNRNPITDMSPAFPGMLADSGLTDKITIPANASIKFGTAVGRNGSDRAVNAAGASCVGIALQDHSFGGAWNPAGPIDGYAQFDAVSVIQRGRVWALASGTCTKGAAAKFAADGAAADSGTALPGARFLSGDFSFNSFIPGIGTQRVVLVELNNPTIDAVA